MDNSMSNNIEGSAGEGKNLQASEKLFFDSCQASGAAASAGDRVVGLLSNAGSQIKNNLLEFSSAFDKPPTGAGAGIIPPYMLEELAKRNPAVPYYDSTLHKMTQQSWWPFPWPHPTPTTGTNGEREVYDARGKESLPGKKARVEGEKPTGKEEVDKAYDFTGEVRSFYKDVFNRNSIDGKGMKFISTVNYGDNYENAFWNGKQMTYGHPGKDSPFQTFMLLDVCGHEITHGVTEKESNLKYYGQAGALNESLSDVFGELIKQKAAHQQAKDADWLVGAGIWKPSVKGRALRDMLHPGTAYDDPTLGKDPQPDHMKNYYKTSGDNGGVHYNSGIPNKAFATFAVSVGGNAWEEPGKIWYAARKAAGDDPSFAQFAYQTIEQAKKLGYEKDVPQLEKSWADVGVKPSASDKDTDTPIKKPHVGWTPLFSDSQENKKAG